MSGPETLVPIVLFTTMFAMVFGIVYIKSRENMAMIERGMNPRVNNSGPRPFLYLKYGLLLIGAGIGLFLAYFIDSAYPHKVYTPEGHVYYSDNPAVYFALIGIGGGLGLVISFFIEKKYWLDKKKDE
jgi:hypothetical protein